MIDLQNKKILLIRNDNIGDLICTTPAIEALRKKYPSAIIDIVVNSYNYEAIHNNPFVNTIYCYTKPKHKKNFLEKIKAAYGKFIILMQIFNSNYDAVVILRSSYSKSAALFAYVSRASYRLGVKNERGRDYLTHYIPFAPNKHEVLFCIDFLKPFDVVYNNEQPQYYISQESTQKYASYKNAILFHISSRIPENQYSKDKFQHIINTLTDYDVLISAEPLDYNDALWIQDNTHAKFIQTTSLRDLAGLIQNVALFVTLDGGAMHIGPAVNTKTIALSGKTNMQKWHPWGYFDLVLQHSSKMANNISCDNIVQRIKDAY